MTPPTPEEVARLLLRLRDEWKELGLFWKELGLFWPATDAMNEAADALEAEHAGRVAAEAEIEALKHDMKHMYESLNGEAAARVRADARAERLREALRDLLGQTNNIEVLGEWSALDVNLTTSKKMRAEVDKIIARCRDCLAAKGDAT